MEFLIKFLADFRVGGGVGKVINLSLLPYTDVKKC